VHDKQKALEEMAERDEKMSKGLFVGFTFRYAIPFVTTRMVDVNDLQTSQACCRRRWQAQQPKESHRH
jgi:hypothetical protein